MTDHAPVHRLLEDSADRRADHVAVVHGDKHFTYSEIEARANRLASVLIGCGVRPGDRVGLLADNGIEYVAGFFGILKAGACVVALNSANKGHTHNKLLADAGACGLVTRAAQVRRDFHEVLGDLPELRFAILDRAAPDWGGPQGPKLILADEVAAADPERPGIDVSPQDNCLILYTSGSTGRPRGVTLNHGNLAANTRQILGYLHLDQDDRVMCVLPFSYSFGNSLLMTHFAVGGRVVIDNRFAYPATILETMAAAEVTGFSGVPSTYAILCAKTEFLTTDLPSLRYLTQAGGGMSPTLTRKVHEAFKGRADLFVMYGQTEASARLSYVPPERLEEKLGSIGIGIPGVELSVRRNDGRECDVDEVGEVTARGDNIMQGYWNDPEETALVLKDRVLFTGDLGRKDADGFIFLVDRIKNMIKAGANRVSAKEVEDAICEVEGVAEACVVGVPDELLGEAIVAHVVPVPGVELSEQQVLAHLRDRLALFKLPSRVHFRDDLPRNSAGKVLKGDLKAG